MDINRLSCNVNVLAITLEDEGLDEFELDEESEKAEVKADSVGRLETSEETDINRDTELLEADINRETELLDDFRYKLLEDRGGDITEESTLLRDLKDLKEKTLERKRARRLKKLRVKFQDKVQLSPFQRSCCNKQCLPHKKDSSGDDMDNSILEEQTVGQNVID